ncbi:MAG: polyprenyl diphosphate synthase [Candidatus Babeliales bacterium]
MTSRITKVWQKMFNSDEENMQELCSRLHHFAIIPDGDRRWARMRGLTIKDGYQEMVNRLVPIVEFFLQAEIPTLTIWLSSPANMIRRPKEQMIIFHEACAQLCELVREMVIRENCKVVHLGQKTPDLPECLRKNLTELEIQTKIFNSHTLNLGIIYGGQDEIVRATKKIVAEGLTPDQITREVFEQHTDFGGQPYPCPDFIIRTGGENRLSGFMSWELEYAEIYFSDKFFPDFTINDLKHFIREFNSKERRFGGGS